MTMSSTQFFNNCIKKNYWFYILSSIAVAFIIASFVLPPEGEIHPSVIAAVGEIFAFASLGTVIKAIDKNMSAKIQHGPTSVILNDDSDDEHISGYTRRENNIREYEEG